MSQQLILIAQDQIVILTNHTRFIFLLQKNLAEKSINPSFSHYSSN